MVGWRNTPSAMRIRSIVERRAQSRQPFRCEVEVLGAEVSLRGVISDLSLAGCYIETQTPVPVGTRMEFLFKLRERPFSLVGTVRYVHPQMGMGVEFLKVSPEQLEMLRRIIGDSEQHT
jgi:uncharacterized protein (TIGR02266 family)